MSAAPISIREVAPLDRRAALSLLDTPGAALFEGWSDEPGWRTVLPWPEEIVELPWSRAADWRTIIHAIWSRPQPSSVDELGGAPFVGGWVGFLAYDAGALEEAAPLYEEVPPEPPVWFARHRAGVVVRPDGKHFLFAPADLILAREQALDFLRSRTSVPPRTPQLHEGVSDSLASGAYVRAVDAIRESIARGDVYQVNLTRRFRAACADGAFDPVDLYLAITGDQPPRCSAFLRGGSWAIASASPEVFLRFDASSGIAESRPIKGTIARSGADDAEVAALRASSKDESEHLMIVDLVRNDLGRVAPAGRVTVPEYKAVRTLKHVHHLESTVRADGLHERSLADLLAALFPAGSITGAPKRAAVHAIRVLEPVPRGVYTGAIGFVDDRGATELSVAIRTSVIAADHVRYHAGGGIVWDSVAALEDAECRAKSVAFLDYLAKGRR